MAEHMALEHFRSSIEVLSKEDGSPVTEADLAIEKAIAATLKHERPADALCGEEFGEVGISQRRWIIDPIDGTTWFINGEENWGTHIALEVEGEVVVSVFTRPTARTRWWALKDSGAYRSSSADPLSGVNRLHVSTSSDVGNARVGGYIPPHSPSLAALHDECTYVEDELSVVGAVAEGRLDACLDEGGRPWDLAPGVLIVREAGGTYNDPAGATSVENRWGLYSNTNIQAPMFKLLSPLAQKPSPS